MLRALHVSQSSCVLHTSVLPSFTREESRHTMNSTLTKCDKTHGHKENSILSSIYILLFQSTLDDIVSNQLNAKQDNVTRFRQHEH